MATQREVDDDPIVRAIRRTPALRREDNTALARIVAQGGVEGERARDRMITGNMRLVLILAGLPALLSIPWISMTSSRRVIAGHGRQVG